MAKKSVFVCSSCGYESIQWRGKCPACDSWNSFAEESVKEEGKQKKTVASLSVLTKMEDIEHDTEERLNLGGELDRVLGGGAVFGSMILIGGEPGIGKSTLLLKAASLVGKSRKVIYFSGEESSRQVKMRAKRIEAVSDNLYISTQTDVDSIIASSIKEKPSMIIIDSLQTLHSDDLRSIAGSVSQIRDSAVKLLSLAKEENIIVFLIGHITKEGSLAGPKILEHTVDCVLYFEGDRQGQYRIIRGIKNRFGSIDEIGIFEMRGDGLVEVSDASMIFMRDNEEEVPPGSVLTPVAEGSRIFCVEEQALVSTTLFGYPRRLAMGFDINRLQMLCAILSKRGNIKLDNQDVHVNIAQGLTVKETASDLAVCMAIVSSLSDIAIPRHTAFIGETGLSGEVRPVRFTERRVREMSKFGIKNFFLPRTSISEAEKVEGVNAIGCSNLREVIERALSLR